MSLTEEQKKQIEKQLNAHNHEGYKRDILISDDLILRGFSVHKNAMRPEMMTSLILAKWLFFNNGLYRGKSFLDIGCGTGIQGIVAGLSGANKIVFSDISDAAIENAKENVKIFDLAKKSKVIKGDLFEGIKEKFDLIVFNHPFFSDHPFEKFKVSGTMLGGSRGELLSRFLREAKNYLKDEGKIIMPYFKLAGPINDPEIQAPKEGYNVEVKFNSEIKTGLQQGQVTISELILQKRK
ncbi:Ribosomal protein L11 methyltransferase [uncultured archaeon]|nr:Ribosomal protein L11 methyltransferase [uncultured archaeon]